MENLINVQNGILNLKFFLLANLCNLLLFDLLFHWDCISVLNVKKGLECIF